MPLEGAHILRKSLGNLQLTETGTNEYEIASQSGGGWESYTNTSAATFFVNRDSYFDLSGYTREELTTFPMNWDIAEDARVYADTSFDPAVGYISSLKIWNIISEKPITDEDLDAFGPATFATGPAPGFLGSHHELRGIVGGRWREYSWDQGAGIGFVPPNIQALGASVAAQGEWGLCQATTVQHLYITIIIQITDLASAMPTLKYPNTAWSIGVVTAEEKDLVYVERLRRSWEQR